LGDNMLTACESLLARVPDAQIWCLRVGVGPVLRFGARPRRERT
jgi:hypothetical protein